MALDEREQYRSLIDALVRECRSGQGTVLPAWARRGTWSTYALDHPDEMAAERRINELLARLSSADRDVVAEMLAASFEAGVHTSLRVLHEHELRPFDEAYEATPFHDFAGRLDDWQWPV